MGIERKFYYAKYSYLAFPWYETPQESHILNTNNLYTVNWLRLFLMQITFKPIYLTHK